MTRTSLVTHEPLHTVHVDALAQQPHRERVPQVVEADCWRQRLRPKQPPISSKRLTCPQKGFKRGDLFEIVLIQAKGGKAPWPTPDDVLRLRAVQRYYRAREVLLAQWHREKGAEFFKLVARKRAFSPNGS